MVESADLLLISILFGKANWLHKRLVGGGGVTLGEAVTARGDVDVIDKGQGRAISATRAISSCHAWLEVPLHLVRLSPHQVCNRGTPATFSSLLLKSRAIPLLLNLFR